MKILKISALSLILFTLPLKTLEAVKGGCFSWCFSKNRVQESSINGNTNTQAPKTEASKENLKKKDEEKLFEEENKEEKKNEQKEKELIEIPGNKNNTPPPVDNEEKTQETNIILYSTKTDEEIKIDEKKE
jgi:hypothetical protein